MRPLSLWTARQILPDITLDNLTKDKLNKLKNWYIENGYSNSTICNRFKYLKSFFIWLRSEGYELQPSVFAYKPNLTVVSKTVTFLKHKELMDFYNFKFAEDEKNLELARDMFCFMAFTSIRYSDLENLKKANVFEDHIEICTKKTHDKLTIPLTIHAKEIIDKFCIFAAWNGFQCLHDGGSPYLIFLKYEE